MRTPVSAPLAPETAAMEMAPCSAETGDEPAQAAVQVSFIVVTGLPPPLWVHRLVRRAPSQIDCSRKSLRAGLETGKIILTCDFAKFGGQFHPVTRMSPSCTTDTTRSP